jgi:hypothetical protein
MESLRVYSTVALFIIDLTDVRSKNANEMWEIEMTRCPNLEPSAADISDWPIDVRTPSP